MATLPPWLVDFSPIRESVTNAKRIGGTDFQSVLARMNLAQQAAAQRDSVALQRQRMAQQAAQDAAQLEMSAQQTAAQGARADRQLNMTEAQLDRSVQQDRDKALMANRQFQALTGYQSCVQGGGDPRTCALKHLPEIVLSSPSSFVSLLPDPTDKTVGTMLDIPGGGRAYKVAPNRLQVLDPGVKELSDKDKLAMVKTQAEIDRMNRVVTKLNDVQKATLAARLKAAQEENLGDPAATNKAIQNVAAEYEALIVRDQGGPKYRKGQKATQDGVTAVFDGTNWIEIE